jgi:hypothetical protein
MQHLTRSQQLAALVEPQSLACTWSRLVQGREGGPRNVWTVLCVTRLGVGAIQALRLLGLPIELYYCALLCIPPFQPQLSLSLLYFTKSASHSFLSPSKTPNEDRHRFFPVFRQCRYPLLLDYNYVQAFHTFVTPSPGYPELRSTS